MAKRYVLGPNAARKVAELIRGSGEVSRRQGATSGLAFDSEYVAPFTVQWAQSANDGDGAWIIWLPDSRLVTVGNNALDPADGLDDAGGDYPEGWYILDDDVLDPDNGGALYLNIANVATFSGDAVTSNAVSVHICDATVDEDSGERRVKQYVTSAIVIVNGGVVMPFDLAGVVETNQQGTQKRLVVKWQSTGASVRWNHWSLTAPTATADAQGWVTVYTGAWKSAQGFSDTATIELWYRIQVTPSWGVGGAPPTFTVSGQWSVVDDSQSDHTEVELTTAVAPTQTLKSYAVLGVVRATATGAKIEQISHGALTLHDILCIGGNGGGGGEDPTNGTTYPMPFQYKRTDTVDSQGNVTSAYAITNCNFYWDGVYYSIADYVPPATGSVYLKATKSGTGAGTWSFSFVTSPVTPTGENQTIRLYDFAASKIVMDYRTTTLTFGPGPRDYFEVKKPDGSIKAELNATGANAKAVLEGATHNITIDAAGAKNGEVQMRECTYYPPGATTPQKVDVLASSAMTLGPPAVARSFLTGLVFRIEGGKLKVKVYTRNLVTDETSNYDVDICSVRNLDVVTNTDYTNPNFTQQKQTVTVIGTAPSTSPNPTNVFTTTPLSAE